MMVEYERRKFELISMFIYSIILEYRPQKGAMQLEVGN